MMIYTIIWMMPMIRGTDDVDEDTGHDAVEGDEDDMNALRDDIAAGCRMAERARRV